MIHDLVTAILPVIPYVFVGLLLFVLIALVYLFRAFKNEPEKTRVAVMLELSTLRNLRQLFTRKTDAPSDAPRRSLGETISQPMAPVADPRISKPKIEDEEGR